MAWRPAATRSAVSRNAPNVVTLLSGAMSIG